ncbi:MAG: glycoside hydrolase family 127 protein [Verrucomicrobia bacterium]|nr:glycoside hydrolase family 127 protein [Verrucomicrobiota bacterium]
MRKLSTGESGRWYITLAVLVSTCAWGATNLDKVPRLQEPLPAASVHEVGGYVGQRIRANTEGYLKPFDIEQFTRMVEQKKHRDWWWIGEQPGKWLESAVLASRASGDRALERKARQILARFAAAQEPGGYLGITDPAVRTDAQPVRGMDPYELYFMFHGLLTAAEEWNDAHALQTARRLGEYFVQHIGPGKAEFWPSPLRPPENENCIICAQFVWVPEGTRKGPQMYDHSEIAGHTAHYGWEGTLLVDPMLRLYQATGDKRFLDWSTWVVGNIDKWSGWNSFSKLDQIAGGTLGVHQLQPYVHSHTFQMNFLGFLRMYQITGDASYLRKVRGAWDDVARRQLYITGGVSVGEHYEPGYRRPATGPVVETCANMSWMELTQRLLELTANPRYADAIERLLFNHVFAAQTVDGDSYRYHTPPNGFKPDDYFHGPDCCTGSGHRIVAMLPRFIYGQGQRAIYVNQFVPSTAGFKFGQTAVTLKQETRYPETEQVLLRVELEGEAEFTLNVRLPAWCEQPAVELNGKLAPGLKPCTYAALKRIWHHGDTVRVTFPMKPHWIEHDHFEEGSAPWALVRGSVVYALDTVWWNDTTVMAPYEAGEEAGWLRKEANLHELSAAAGALGPFYQTEVKVLSGQQAKATLVPFSNIGRWYRDGAPKPERQSRAFSYAVWLHDSGSAEFTRAAREQQQILKLTKDSVDVVRIGDGKSEHDHNVQGTGNTGTFKGRSYRHAGAGGWFSYDLKVPIDKANVLAVTYWGGETGARTFDVLINDRKLATQKLEMDKAGEFFEVRYPIPSDMVQGKPDDPSGEVRKVTVKFQAHPGNTAGGIFGLRIVRAD